MKLSLQLPGQDNPITLPSNFNSPYSQYLAPPNQGGGLYVVVSQFLNLALYLGGALLVFWLSWGVFEYLVAGGNKDKLALARKKIIHAIVGFVVILLSFSAWTYIKIRVFPSQENPITKVLSP